MFVGKAQRDKGKRGEREVAEICRDFGFPATRTAQHCGKTAGKADVEGVPGLHLEVKRTETLRPWDYMDQALRDALAAGRGEMPTVVWRKNEHDWLALLRFTDLLALVKAAESEGE